MPSIKDLVLIFTLSDCEFAIDVKNLVEVSEGLEFSPGAIDGTLGKLNYRGASIPLLDIYKRLSLPETGRKSDIVVVVRIDKHLIAFPVDSVKGVMEVKGNVFHFPQIMVREQGVFPLVYTWKDDFIISMDLDVLYGSDYISSLIDINEEEL